MFVVYFQFHLYSMFVFYSETLNINVMLDTGNTEGYTECCRSLCDVCLFVCSLDIDECGLNETLCGSHGFCENRLGSFRCLCDQGYQETQDGHSCVGQCWTVASLCRCTVNHHHIHHHILSPTTCTVHLGMFMYQRVPTLSLYVSFGKTVGCNSTVIVDRQEEDVNTLKPGKTEGAEFHKCTLNIM